MNQSICNAQDDDDDDDDDGVCDVGVDICREETRRRRYSRISVAEGC